MEKNSSFFMKKAILQAKRAEKMGEVPIGAVIVLNGEIIARGYNQRETKQDATLHAEIVAIKKACKKLNSWRLDNAEIYVTLEPCAMCAGAILNARIKKVYFGAYEPKGGAVCSVNRLLEKGGLNWKSDFVGGVEEEACSKLLKDFFAKKRK